MARHWIRFAHARLGHLFRYLPQQSAYNKRLNAAGPLISHVIEALARQVPTWHDDLRLIDSTPLPCAASRETVKRSDLAGHCGYGYCRSHSRFFWGLRLYLVTTAEGMPVTWCLSCPQTTSPAGPYTAICSQVPISGRVVAGCEAAASRRKPHVRQTTESHTSHPSDAPTLRMAGPNR